jgi:hypothetical protein
MHIKSVALGKVHLLGGDQDVLKKAHIFTGPLLRLLVNFRYPLQVFKIFNAPPPEFGIEGVQS